MAEYVTIKTLAAQLGIQVSPLYKRVKRDGVGLKRPAFTGSGLQNVTVVPREYADRIRRMYAEAIQE